VNCICDHVSYYLLIFSLLCMSVVSSTYEFYNERRLMQFLHVQCRPYNRPVPVYRLDSISLDLLLISLKLTSLC